MTKISMAEIEAVYAYMSGHPDVPWRLPYEANDEGVSPAHHDGATMDEGLAREANLNAIDDVLQVAAAAAPLPQSDVTLSGLALRLTNDAGLTPTEFETTSMFVERAVAGLINANRAHLAEVDRLAELVEGNGLLLAQARDQSARRLGELRRAARIERFAQQAFDSLGELHNWLSQALTPRYAPLNDEGIELARTAVGKAQTLIVRAVANDPFAPASEATPWATLPEALGKLLGVGEPDALLNAFIAYVPPRADSGPAEGADADGPAVDIDVMAKRLNISAAELRHIVGDIRAGRLTRATVVNGVPYGTLKCVSKNDDGSDCGLCVFIESEFDQAERAREAAGDAPA